MWELKIVYKQLPAYSIYSDGLPHKRALLILVEEFNDKTKIITFNAPIGTLQKILKIKETTLGEFFSWYFVNNFRKYCLELYSALPESLPIYTMEEIDSLKIRMDFA